MRTFKKITDIISTVLLVALVLGTVLLVGVRIVGIEPFIVLSGSMEPEIKTGSLVYVDKVTPEEACNLQVGDTVTFLSNGGAKKVTHKIYSVVGPLYVKNQYGEFVTDENGERTVAIDDRGYPIIMYTTYGINNINEGSGEYVLDGNLETGNLASSNIIGKPMFSVPYLGYLASFAQNPPGKYVVLVICILLVLNTFLGSSSKKERGATPNAETQEMPVQPKEETPNDAESPQPKTE